MATTASVAKEPLYFVHKQICPSLWITVSAQSLSLDDQRDSGHEGHCQPPHPPTPSVWQDVHGDGTESLPVDAKLAGRDRCQSCPEPAVGIRMKALFIKSLKSFMKQDIYKKGKNKQCKMDVQSHKDLLKKSQERNRTE